MLRLELVEQLLLWYRHAALVDSICKHVSSFVLCRAWKNLQAHREQSICMCLSVDFSGREGGRIFVYQMNSSWKQNKSPVFSLHFKSFNLKWIMARNINQSVKIKKKHKRSVESLQHSAYRNNSFCHIYTNKSFGRIKILNFIWVLQADSRTE